MYYYRLEGEAVPTGGRVLPCLVQWLAALQRVEQDVTGEFLGIQPMAVNMKKKLEGDLNDAQMVFGWLMVTFFDVSWGGEMMK